MIRKHDFYFPNIPSAKFFQEFMQAIRDETALTRSEYVSVRTIIERYKFLDTYDPKEIDDSLNSMVEMNTIILKPDDNDTADIIRLSVDADFDVQELKDQIAALKRQVKSLQVANGVEVGSCCDGNHD